MARQPSKEQMEAKRLYLESGGEMPLVEIARRVGKSDGQIRKWKSTYKWDDELKGNVTESKGNVTEKRSVTRSAPAPPPVEEEEETESLDLTPKQRLFVQEYLIDLNATQAAIRAGYSPASAEVTGHRLLRNAKIADLIEQAMRAREQRVQVDADWVLQRLVRLADYNLRDFANLATVKRIFETKSGDVLEDEVQAVVLNPDFDGTIAKSLHQDKDGIKLDMPDRVKALELIGKHIGLFDSPHKKRMDEERLELDKTRLAMEVTKHQAGAPGEKEGLLIEIDYGDDA